MGRYSERLGVRVRPEDRQTLESAAEIRGVDLSDLIRRAALREARRILAAPHTEPLEEAHDGR